jgi:hypothetical protein
MLAKDGEQQFLAKDADRCVHVAYVVYSAASLFKLHLTPAFLHSFLSDKHCDIFAHFNKY